MPTWRSVSVAFGTVVLVSACETPGAAPPADAVVGLDLPAIDIPTRGTPDASEDTRDVSPDGVDVDASDVVIFDATDSADATAEVMADGADGAVEVSVDAEDVRSPSRSDLRFSSGIHHLPELIIPAGVTVTTDGAGTLELLVDGEVRIDGTLDVSGGAGGDGCHAPPTGGDTGSPGAEGLGPGGGGRGGSNFSPPNWPGRPGVGVAAGGGGRAGVNLLPYRVDGITMTEFARGAAGEPAPAPEGGGPSEGGGAATGIYAGGAGNNPAPVSGCDEACYGRFSDRAVPTCCDATWSGGSGGGGSIGGEAARDLALSSTFRPGSGGGGGGGTVACSGGGGGGGGGALRIVSTRAIVLGATARVLANGGAGGNGSDSAGGGGSGGVIDLDAPALTVQPGAVVRAVGGVGGLGYTGVRRGGAGGPGRIRLRVSADACSLLGSFEPPLVMGCAPTPAAVPGHVFIAPRSP